MINYVYCHSMRARLPIARGEWNRSSGSPPNAPPPPPPPKRPGMPSGSGDLPAEWTLEFGVTNEPHGTTQEQFLRQWCFLPVRVSHAHPDLGAVCSKLDLTQQWWRTNTGSGTATFNGQRTWFDALTRASTTHCSGSSIDSGSGVINELARLPTGVVQW